MGWILNLCYLELNSILNRIKKLEEELNLLKSNKSELSMELAKPTIKKISLKEIHSILSDFSKLLSVVQPEHQKSLLHSIIKKITINPSNKISERSIKDIHLFFDTSLKNSDFVLTYDTVHP